MSKDKFGLLAGHIVAYSDDCSCGSGGHSPHEQYCGIEPVMTLEQFALIADAPVNYTFPGQWSTPEGIEDVEFHIYVSTQDNSIKVSVDGYWHSPKSARAFAAALFQAAAYSDQEGGGE